MKNYAKSIIVNMNCNNKIKYPNKNAALFALSQINSDSSNDGRSQTAYECKHHECWHTGHPKDYSDNPIARINQIFEQNQPSKRKRKNKYES